MTAKQYKSFKGLRKESLRDNMDNLEVILADLSEETTKRLAEKHKPRGLEENKLVEVDEDKKELLAEEKNDEIDEEELIFDEKPNRKIVLIVLIILFLIALVIGFLIYKKIIKI